MKNLNKLFMTAYAGSGSGSAGAPKNFRGSSVNDPALRQATRDASTLNNRVRSGNAGRALPNGARQVRRDAGGATVRTGTATIRQRNGGAGNTLQPGAYTRASRPRQARRDS